MNETTRVNRNRLPWSLVIVSLMAMACVLCSCQPTRMRAELPNKDSTRAELSIIPLPVRIDRTSGNFTLDDGAIVSVAATNAEAVAIARYFAGLIARTSGVTLDVRPIDTRKNDSAISFVIDPKQRIDGDTTDEGYVVSVSPQRIIVAARTPHGLFNGAVTLWQLASQSAQTRVPIEIPCVHIEDFPRFAWRGLMLDSSRHFQSTDAIKAFIDEMALHKLDVFHWHLTDDQGWRLEIKKYPKLTQIGAWRAPAHVVGAPQPYGGFYTQEQVRDIVRYAAERYITIVPEIEMPGHAQAAIAAYPEFGVTGRRPPVSPDWGVHTYLYNIDEATFAFLQDVLSETMTLFPGQYIHVGGDEAAKDQWHASPQVKARMRELHIADEAALQSYFIARIEKFVNARGRKLIGWDEILEGGLAPRATVMSWQGVKGGVEAARQDHDVVMSPSPTLYMDHVQSTLHDEPPGRPDVISLSDVYRYEPIPDGLSAAQVRHVIGAQANLWTEYMDTQQRVEHAAFPRAAALAEVLWSPANARNYDSFLTRLPAQFDRYRAAGIAFADSVYAPDIRVEAGSDATRATLRVSTQAQRGSVRYTDDGSRPNAASPLAGETIEVRSGATLNVGVFDHERLVALRTQAIDAGANSRRNSDQLQSCTPGAGLPLRLPGPDDTGVYRVDIFDPCWIYPAVDLDAVHSVDVAAVERAYNFQLWHDAGKVITRAPRGPDGELEVHADTCAGAALAVVPLAGKVDPQGYAPLRVPLKKTDGIHDLCFTFTRAAWNPLWMIDTVQLRP